MFKFRKILSALKSWQGDQLFRVPIIASDTPINRELIVEGETGYLIPLLQRSGRADRARHTDRIFNDRDLAKRLGDNARRRASERFDTERIVQDYAELY